MAVKSVYLASPSIEHDRIHIRDDEHRHLVVGRAEPDEVIEVFDGCGSVWETTVESVQKRETIVKVAEFRRVERDAVDLTLALAMIRVSAFELALEKAVEVGVTQIVPFTAERSNAATGNRQDRWQRILIEAAKQSKRYYLPVLFKPASFDQVLLIPAATKILFAEHNGGPLKSALAGSPVLYLIGPEGGWTDREYSTALDKGFHAVSLGAAILKAETAAIVGAALIRYELAN
jgi:16S rRNA (uracil1498-N3)-methyltransferase